MKIKEVEQIFKNHITTPILSKDGHKLFLYSKKPLTSEQIKYFESMTSEEIKFLLKNAMGNFEKHKVEDIPKNYGEH